MDLLKLNEISHQNLNFLFFQILEKSGLVFVICEISLVSGKRFSASPPLFMRQPPLCPLFFHRYGRVESVKVLPKRGSEGGVAAFVDFVDIKSAQKAHNSINKMGDRDLRTDYNEPGTIPSAARGLDDSLSIGSRGRDVSGFARAAGGPVYGPPASLHSREARYERRLDG